MRLPNLSPAIERRIPGSPPAGPGRGEVRPRCSKEEDTCSGACQQKSDCRAGCTCGSTNTCVIES